MWHDVIEERIRFARIEQRQNVGVLEVGRDLDLFEKSLRGQLGPQHLHRDLAVVFEVLSEVDGGHAPGTEFFLDGIAVGEGGFEAVEKVWHCFLALLATVLE